VKGAPNKLIVRLKKMELSALPPVEALTRLQHNSIGIRSGEYGGSVPGLKALLDSSIE